MREYTVLYENTQTENPEDIPLGFYCMADDKGHAQEQCENAYPDCCVVWVFRGRNYAMAVDEYFYFNV